MAISRRAFLSGSMDVRKTGSNDITMTLEPVAGEGEAAIEIGGAKRRARAAADATECRFAPVDVASGIARMKTMITNKTGGRGARFVEIRRNS